MKCALISGLLVLFTVPVVAFSQCNDDEGTTQSVYNKCYKPRLDQSNETLQKEVTITEKALQGHYRTEGTVAADWFKNSQVAWERYRYLSCEVQSIAEAGSQSSRMLERTECEILLNTRRIKELKKLKQVLSP